METKLIVISQLGKELIGTNLVKLYCTCIKHLQNVIYDLYPAMFINEDYKIYWRYDDTELFNVADSFSLHTAMYLMSECVFYMVIRDVAPWNAKQYSQPDGELEAVRYCIKYLLPPQKFYTNDLKQIFQMITSLRKGFPKEPKKLEPPSPASVPVKPLATIPKKGAKKDDKNKKKKGKKK